MRGSKIKSYKTTCSYCGVGCGIVIKKDQYNRLSLEGDEEHPVNKGMLCSKGRTLHYTVMDQSDRLLYPQMRWHRDQPLRRVSWDTAMNRAAAVFKSIIDRHGPDSVAFYVSGQLLTEEYYLVNKLIKGFIGSNNIDTNSRLCMSSAVVGYKMTMGEDSVPASYSDIELADTFMITGANPAWCHPIIFRRLENHKEKNPDTKFIVVDPRKTHTTSIADLHLQLNPGTDIYLYNAIGRLLIEAGKIDEEFVVNHTDGFESYKEHVFKYTLEEAAEICDLDTEDIEMAASWIGDATGFMTMWTMGLNQSVVGVNKNLSLLDLSLITGHVGKPGSGPLSLTGQPNAMGGREVGGLSNMLAAHRDYANPDHVAEVGKYWDTDKISTKPGLTATQMMDEMNSGELKAIWVICTNPLVSWPDARKADAALKKANFVIVQDISGNSDTVEYADLVLPAAGYLEKEGTMTNSERRISYLPQVYDPPGEARPDSDILIDFAQRMGYGKSFDYSSQAEVYDEHAGLTKGTNLDVSGVSYEVLQNKRSVQWPFTNEKEKSTQRLFTDRKFFTPNKRAQLHSVPPENQSEPVSPDFPFVLTTGRIRDQWHTMTRSGKVQKLNQHIDKPFLEIHPEDAELKGIRDGDVVQIYNGRGEVRVSAKVTSDIKQGVVFLPMHWGKKLGKDLNRTNNLTNNLVDPKSKQPDFKFSSVNVEKYRKQKQKIAIVGAGAAAFKFITAYRERNQGDEINVFSKEKIPFYNRVMLPHYISGHKDWEGLLKHTESFEKEYDCKIHAGTGIASIDREKKSVVDDSGQEHDYDLLVLATGSGAFCPPNVPKDMRGIYTLRSRADADYIKDSADDNDRVVIVGGGILGIELADSLNLIGKKVTIVQRNSRLMERQLDLLGSELLDLELKDRDINIIYNDEVVGFEGTDQLEGLQLRSGRSIDCGTTVFAIGTRPNVQFVKESGVVVGRGVVINDFFQSSDPSIFAIGEIAQHKNQLFGITAAAEEQAELLVSYIAGDTSKHYEGSLLMSILKVEELDLCSIGTFEKPSDNDDYEEITFLDRSRGLYKKCLVYKDILIGCILIGNKDEFVEFRDLIKNRVELGDKRMELLGLGREPREPVKGHLVCSCNNVGEGNITDKIKGGCTDFSALCSETGAGTGCGSCKPEVRQILQENTVLPEIVSV